jgi:hypothetical protein
VLRVDRCGEEAYDGQYFIQKFTPRRAKSVWSKINVEKVEALIGGGEDAAGGAGGGGGGQGGRAVGGGV